MRHHHFYHGHKARRLAYGDFWVYELSMWLHTLAHALVSVFIPVLLLRSGYPLSAVVAYYILFNLFDVPFNLLGRVLVAKFGARFTIGLATIAVIAFFSIFLNLKAPSWQMIVLLSFFAALYDGLYWVGHIFLFINSNQKVERTGRGTGILYAVRQCALMLGPIIGAALLVLLSQKALLIAAIAIFVLSIVPLAEVDDFPDTPKTPHLSFKKFFAHPRGRRAYLSTAFYAVHDTCDTIIFPLFIFVTFGTLQSVALVPVAMSLAAMVVAFLLGGVHPEKRGFAIAAGAAAIALVWIVRLSFPAPPVYYGSIFAIGILVYFVLVPLDSSIFEYAREVDDPLSASMYRNMTYALSSIVFYSILAALSSILSASFALAAVSLLGLFLFNVGLFFFPASARVRSS